MAQAEHTIITRRSLVAAAAAGVSILSTTALPARALESSPDPILALIAAHKAAYATLDQACLRLSDLEHELPAERRKEWYPEDKGTDVGANDDPRWTAAIAAYEAASDAETRAAWALAHAQPIRVAGAAALLHYAHEYTEAGCEWPGEPEEEDGREDWNNTFHRSLAAALEALA